MSSQSRIYNFFASTTGKQFSLYSTGFVALGAFAVKYFPHTFFSQNYREFVACYKDGIEKRVPDAIMKRFEIAQDILKLSDYEKNHMSPFMVTGFDTVHIGSLKVRFGALTGIPTNFSYTEPCEIDKANIMIRGKSIDWNSNGGKRLEQSLVLTEDEQIFALVREMIQLQDDKILLKSIYPTGAIALYYILSSGINTKFNLFIRPLSFRLSFYMIVGLFCFGIYSFLNDYTQVSADGNTDQRLAALGKGFIEAGVRFYAKLLNKNIAIRDLTNDDSEYTALGNESFIIRRKRLPLTLRKAFFDAKLKELNQVSADGNTDQRLAALGKGFIEAGVRFYAKLLNKNIAIRDLTNDDSEYTALGNESFIIRRKRLPLTLRKAFFDAKLKELNQVENENISGVHKNDKFNE
ncbi:CLUMA_CG015765, isoform A [Clunio marinus]|uniref:CLUMA_CG015765, isoform A n=1 Tax=Clunio marinus TaxID=568069 RepID=A0A1J1IRM6_9DIPT|nr:CLUMA_CG015765, isoform A [Clunio marinus]